MSDILVAAVPASAVGASKWHLGILNAAGPRFVVDVVAVQVDPNDAAAVTGTQANFVLKRVTSLGSGNSPVTVRKLDKTTPDLPAGISIQSALVSPAAEAAPELASFALNTEETSVTATADALWPPRGLEGEPVTLNSGEGVAVQQGALASAGNVDVYLYFRWRRK